MDKPASAPTLAQLSSFDEIIDVRSPSEFAEDHIPGAVNLPVLDDAQRAQIGTLHKLASAFEAKKAGAGLVSRNIARHLETHFAAKPIGYRPLIYCWRGGNRSGSLTHVLQKIGFRAEALPGGYKTYRRAVREELETLPAQFRYRVLCGPTGSGKSRLLAALARAGAQVLDLEALAQHRGSLLGLPPDGAQPSQKYFDSLLAAALRGLDGQRPVYVEAESKKIGNLGVHDALLAAMRASPCVRLDVPLPARVRLLLEDYDHFLAQPELLTGQLAYLAELRGHAVVERWLQLIRAGQWQALVQSLLEEHYDPAYARSLARNYPARADDGTLHLAALDASSLNEAARQLLAG